jgi:hypothetical protein
MHQFDVAQFWESSEYADQEYADDPVTDLLVVEVERAFGYRLPRANVELMKFRTAAFRGRSVIDRRHARPGPSTTSQFRGSTGSEKGNHAPSAASWAASSRCKREATHLLACTLLTVPQPATTCSAWTIASEVPPVNRKSCTWTRSGTTGSPSSPKPSTPSSAASKATMHSQPNSGLLRLAPLQG